MCRKRCTLCLSTIHRAWCNTIKNIITSALFLDWPPTLATESAMVGWLTWSLRTGPTILNMRSYTCIVNQQSDGTWVAYFPALESIPSVVASSKRRAKKQSFRELILFLQKCKENQQSLPKDTSTTYFHKVDINQLHRYTTREKEPKDYGLR